MPELPEVEVVRRGLEEHAAGRTVARALVRHPRAVRRHLAGAADLERRLVGRILVAARRRGKYLWLELSGDVAGSLPDQALVVHLGMSGQLLVRPVSAEPAVVEHPHLRFELGFADDGPDLWFVDQRTFGALALEPLVGDACTADDAEAVPASVAHIARDLFDQRFDAEAVVEALRRRRTGLKRALLDQTLVSGIGNIYADEALWRARLHGARPTETLRRPEARRVLEAAKDVMAEALGQGGTSFDALYVDVNGRSGYFDRSLAVYGQTGRPCPRCGTPIRRDAFMNRSSFSCPRCQPRPRAARW